MSAVIKGARRTQVPLVTERSAASRGVAHCDVRAMLGVGTEVERVAESGAARRGEDAPQQRARQDLVRNRVAYQDVHEEECIRGAPGPIVREDVEKERRSLGAGGGVADDADEGVGRADQRGGGGERPREALWLAHLAPDLQVDRVADVREDEA